MRMAVVVVAIVVVVAGVALLRYETRETIECGVIYRVDRLTGSVEWVNLPLNASLEKFLATYEPNPKLAPQRRPLPGFALPVLAGVVGLGLGWWGRGRVDRRRNI